MTNSLIVKAYGMQLDELRSEASRITRDHGFKWSAEKPGRGFRFSFTDSASKNEFAAFCSDLGVSFTVADALKFEARRIVSGPATFCSLLIRGSTAAIVTREERASHLESAISVLAPLNCRKYAQSIFFPRDQT